MKKNLLLSAAAWPAPGEHHLVRKPAVLVRVGVSGSTLERLPDFPEPVRLSARCVGWWSDEVDAYLEARPRRLQAPIRKARLSSSPQPPVPQSPGEGRS